MADEILELLAEIKKHEADGDKRSVAELRAELKSLRAAAAVERGEIGADEAHLFE